jgi:hypothetical protein
MAIRAVELYERLKPRLGETEAKELLEYVDERVRGEVATKEDLQILKMGLEARFREEIWKLRLLVIAVLILTVVLNPKLLEIVGRVLGAAQ